MKIKLLIIFLLLLSWMTGVLYAQDGFQYYYQAKKLMHQREYDKALKLLEKLQKEFPNSKYNDDAEFWSAYILEKQKRYDESFNRYKELKRKYPNSPWADDAEVQQIGIAEKLANQGKRLYLNFLVERAKSKDKTIKYQASMSLGKLRDERALPGLRQIANNGDKDMSQMARKLIKRIENENVKKQNEKEIRKKFPFGEVKPGRDRTEKSPVNAIGKPPSEKKITHPPSRPNNKKQSPKQGTESKRKTKGKSF